MSSKSRVMSAIGHVRRDRLPFYIMGFYEQEAQERIQRHLRVEDGQAAYDALGIDVRVLGSDWSKVPGRVDERGRKLEGWPAVWGGGGSPYTDRAHARPLQAAETIAQVDAYSWPNPEWINCPPIDEARRDYLARHWVNISCGPIWCQTADLMSMETALLNMRLNPKVIEATVAHVVDFWWEMIRRQLEAYDDLVDCFHIWDDAAADTTLFFSIEDWRRFYKPGLVRLFDLANAHGKSVWYHCCGAMSALMPDLIDMGMDVLEPCQVHLPGMAPERLHRDFGDHVVFYGAINTQHALPFGSEEDVRREVRDRIRVLGADGAYIVGPDHSVNKDVPPQNVVALYDKAARL